MDFAALIQSIVTTAGADEDIEIEISFDINSDSPLSVETFHNEANPGGCDKARTFVEQGMGISNDVESATEKARIEEKIIKPMTQKVGPEKMTMKNPSEGLNKLEEQI